MEHPSKFSSLLLAAAALFLPLLFFFSPASVKAYTDVYSGTVTTTITWSTAGSPYVVHGEYTVSSVGTLNIDPGVTLKFIDTTSRLVVSGTLNAQGTAGSLIYLTSYKDDSADGQDTNGDGASSGSARDWDSIKVNSGGSANIAHAVIRYGGSGTYAANLLTNGGTFSIATSTISNTTYGLYHLSGSVTIVTSTIFSCTVGVDIDSANGSGTISVSDSVFQNNSYGVWAYGSGSLTLTNNAFSNNSTTAASLYFTNGLTFTHSGNTATGNAKNGYLIYGAINTNQHWNSDGPSYIISDRVIVPTGKTLTIDPGAVIKFVDNLTALSISGQDARLKAYGSAEQPIIFGSEQEFVTARILCGLAENHKLGLRHGQALGFQQ